MIFSISLLLSLAFMLLLLFVTVGCESRTDVRVECTKASLFIFGGPKKIRKRKYLETFVIINRSLICHKLWTSVTLDTIKYAKPVIRAMQTEIKYARIGVKSFVGCERENAELESVGERENASETTSYCMHQMNDKVVFCILFIQFWFATSESEVVPRWCVWWMTTRERCAKRKVSMSKLFGLSFT